MRTETKKHVRYWVMVGMVFALVMAIITLAPRQAHAAELAATPTVTAVQTTTLQTQSTTAGKAKTTKTSNPYSDVTKKSVGTKALNSIKWLKSKGAYKGVIKTKKFYPYHNITRGEFVKVLKNLWGAKVTKAVTGVTNKVKAKAAATDKWVKTRFVRLAKKGFGMNIHWGNPTKDRIGRATVANLTYNFANFDPALMPK